MKKVILIVGGVVLIIISSWYLGDKQRDLPSQLPEETFVLCTRVKDSNTNIKIDQYTYTVEYPSSWESKG